MSTVDDEARIDLALGLIVTDEDRAALRRLREQTPSWLEWNWRALIELMPRDALAKRPTAADHWTPFRLE
jgi:hypothetical protein